MILHETNKIAELKRKGYGETARLMELAVEAAQAVREHAIEHVGDSELVFWGAMIALGQDSRFDYADILDATGKVVKFSISLCRGSEHAIVEVDLTYAPAQH